MYDSNQNCKTATKLTVLNLPPSPNLYHLMALKINRSLTMWRLGGKGVTSRVLKKKSERSKQTE